MPEVLNLLWKWTTKVTRKLAVGASESTISSALGRFRETGSTSRRTISASQRITMQREDTNIVIPARCNPFHSVYLTLNEVRCVFQFVIVCEKLALHVMFPWDNLPPPADQKNVVHNALRRVNQLKCYPVNWWVEFLSVQHQTTKSLQRIGDAYNASVHTPFSAVWRRWSNALFAFTCEDEPQRDFRSLDDIARPILSRPHCHWVHGGCITEKTLESPSPDSWPSITERSIITSMEWNSSRN